MQVHISALASSVTLKKSMNDSVLPFPYLGTGAKIDTLGVTWLWGSGQSWDGGDFLKSSKSVPI